MIKRCIILWLVVGIFSKKCFAFASSDTEATMTSKWLATDWSTEKSSQEIVVEDTNSGCICRQKPDHHIECYGTTTCVSFPRGLVLPPGIYDFKLKTTKISKLSAEELTGYEQLRTLDIDANFRLIEIEPGFFSGMTHIVNLSISFNTELQFLHEDTFLGLDNIRRLKLIENGFRHIFDVSRALKLSVLPKIESISLKGNVFKEINGTSFKDLTGTDLMELDLVMCQIEEIHPKALNPLQKLKKLRLGENMLKEEQLQELFESMAAARIPVTLLNLYQLGFRKKAKLTSLLNFIAKLNVTHLNLRRNHIENLCEGLFPHMPDLHTLDLREVSALTIEPNALNQSIMPKLKTLLLGGNRLSRVMSGILLPQLSDLDISGSSTSDQSPSYFDANSKSFQNMTQLTSLNLSFNRIVTISNMTFTGIRHLRLLGLKNATIYYIAENSFRMIPNLFLLNLDDNPFKPFNSFANLIFDGLGRLEILLLSNCDITHFKRPDIFDSLIVLRYLNLRGNKLTQISPNLIKPLSALTGLDLSYNELTPWDRTLNISHPNHPNLTVLLLQHNRFTYLTVAMMDDFWGICQLDISGNPYVCDNTLLETTNFWYKSRNLTRLATYLLDSTKCLSPDEWRDKPLINFLISNETLSSDVQGITFPQYLAFAGMFCLVIPIICAAVFHYRWHFRYWIFLAKVAYVRSTAHLKSVSKSVPTVYKYDVFVSYSHEDRNFILKLISKLENEKPYLKLCVYERDFEIGSVISETIMNKVSSSRKIIFVVSNSFAQSQWCIWELQLAEYHAIFFRSNNGNLHLDNSFIVIKLGPLMKSLVTPLLGYILRTRIYLEWSSDIKNEKIFWEKLKNYLTENSRTER